MKSMIRSLINAVYVLSPITILFSISVFALKGNQDTSQQEGAVQQEDSSDSETNRKKNKESDPTYTAVVLGHHYLYM